MGFWQKNKDNKEQKIREKLENLSNAIVAGESHLVKDINWIAPSIQAYTSYLNYKSQERSLKQIRITALATVVLAVATLILAGVTAFHA
jgi:hypothetical protein